MLPQIRTYRPAGDIHREAGVGSDWIRLFDQAFNRDLNGRTAWTPAADLYETDDGFVLEMGLPGFRTDSVEVTVERGVLTITGARVADEDADSRHYHVREHTYDRFTRSFALPSSVIADDVTADFENGMLTVKLPKVAEAKPQRVKIAAK